MLQNKQTTYYIRRCKMNNIYINHTELSDLVDNLSPREVKFYSQIKYNALSKPPASYYLTPELAATFKMTTKAMSDMKSKLKKKGYLIIITGKDERGNPTAKVIVGKDQVELYNLGLDVEITDSKTYKEMLKHFPITDQSLDLEKRKELVELANEWLKGLNH